MSSITASATVPASIDRAVSFLTRPLILTQSPALVTGVQAILRTTLGANFNPIVDTQLTLTLSANALPPRPILAACFISGMYWVEWMRLLGGREFDLTIEAQSVKVTYRGSSPHTVIVWSEVAAAPAKHAPIARFNFNEPQVPISKLGQQSAMQAALRATVDSAVSRTKARTAAQQLLETKHEEEEADEILAMISKCAITTPTPTSEMFIINPPTLIMPISTTAFPSPLSSPEGASSPESSRPSSRSSSFSTFSFSSDDESNSSVSSASSFDFLASTKPTSTLTTSMKSINEKARAFVPRQQSAPRVFIDNTKKEVTKYLYQGGVSTVLTGGVMLGGASAPAKAKANQVPKYRAPVGGKKFPPTQNAASANTWRRATRV